MYHILAPKAIDKIVRGSGKYQPRGPPPPTRQAWSSCPAAVFAGIGGVDQQVDLPARAAVSIRSEPLMRLPARASMPRRSSAAWRSACSVRSPRSGGTDVAGLECPLERALELALGVGGVELGAARRRSTRRGPGARARTSGATSPSGESASRISSSRVPLRRERTQVRSGCARGPAISRRLGSHWLRTSASAASSGFARRLLSSSSSNQWARAAMMISLPCSSVRA